MNRRDIEILFKTQRKNEKLKYWPKNTKLS